MKGKELASIVLQSISHPLRMTMMEKLGAQPESFSGVMLLCGLDPRHSSGLFNYHLTELINCEVVQKDGEFYRLTDFGFSILDALKKLELECSSFLMKVMYDPRCYTIIQAYSYALERGGGKEVRKVNNKDER